MPEICNCPLGLPCEQNWEQMDEIPGALAMRFCRRCEKSVHWASSEAQRRRLADQGRAVAAELPLSAANAATGTTLAGIGNEGR